MAFTDLIFSADAKGTTIGTLRLDCLTAEGIELPSDVTAFPVEDGSPVSDAILPGSPKIRITGTVSATNVTMLGGLLSKGSALSGKPKLLSAISALGDIYRKHVPVTVVTGLGVHMNLGMTAAKIDRDNGQNGGGVLTVQCEFMRIRKVTLRKANVPADDATKGKTGATRAKAGKAATTEPAAPAASQSGSILKSLRTSLGL